MLTIRKMQEVDRHALCELAVAGSQSDFVLPISETLQNQQSSEDFHVICLEDAGLNSQIIGFFILDHAFATYPEFSKLGELGLRSYFIDSRFQGAGYGGQSCRLLKQYVVEHYPSVTNLVLTVNLRNTRAIALYLACGFLDSQKLYLGGPAGPQQILYLPLEQ
ncbi:GNAT family N-acetyltransferase [Photobacterium sp. SDRW27]|uniref:GNAT family N-acetyltransferase n=1 Tax=Photobacterium obscurum TaxID=2829490 RepID=UPI0022448677|nr:GNAT family protein [Photobacterium obscurum]MCW8331026.1 GNAT family N-acetyltransferase [Photobacterium obscurum]